MLPLPFSLRRSKSLRLEVDRADGERVAAIQKMFSEHGYEEQDAFIRARILYFMQVGYYALELGESVDTRMEYIGDYLRSFTGREPDTADVADYVERLRDRASRKTLPD